MAELQEQYRHWDEREGMVHVGHLPVNVARGALGRSVPTMRAARTLFDAIAQRLGEGAWEEPAGDGRRCLLVRDPGDPAWVVPFPLLTWTAEDGGERRTVASFVNPGAPRAADAPDDWKPGDPPYWEVEPEPRIFPRGPDMHAGRLRISEGPTFHEWVFDGRGLKSETIGSGGDSFEWIRYGNERPFALDPLARPPTLHPFPLLVHPDLTPDGIPPDRLVEAVANLRPGDRCTPRVRLPLPLPGGAEGAWLRASSALRRALWEERIPADARHAVVDGYEGHVVAWGATQEEATARWDEEVARVRPQPPGWGKQEAPPPPAKEIPDEAPSIDRDDEGRVVRVSTGTLHFTLGGGGAAAWPIPLPRYVPAVSIPLPEGPQDLPEAYAAAGFTRWVRLLDEWGGSCWALLKGGDDGFVLVGEGALDLVTDLPGLDDALDAADAECSIPDAIRERSPVDEWHWRLSTYSCFDNGHRRAIPPTSSSSAWGGGFDPWRLDGRRCRWGLARLRHLG